MSYHREMRRLHRFIRGSAWPMLAGLMLSLLGLLCPWAQPSAHAAARPEVDPSAERDPELVVRSQRPFFVASEAGWNGIAGLGLNLGYHPHPLLALELGGGGGSSGARIGLRARWNILRSPCTPFLALGGIRNFGVTGLLLTEDNSGGQEGQTSLESANPVAGFGLQTTGGLSWVRPDGFVFTAALGYLFAPLPDLTPKSPDIEVDFIASSTFANGSGPVVTLAMGYAF